MTTNSIISQSCTNNSGVGDFSRFNFLKDYEPSASTSEIVITSKSHPELWARLNSQYESQLRIHRLKKLSLSVLSNSKNRAKRARKKSRK